MSEERKPGLYNIVVFSPGVTFNNPQDEATVKEFERAYLHKLAQAHCPNHQAIRDFVDAFHADMPPEMSEQHGLQTIGRLMLQQIVEKIEAQEMDGVHPLYAGQISSDVFQDLYLVSSIATSSLFSDAQTEQGMLRPWVSSMLGFIDNESSETYTWGNRGKKAAFLPVLTSVGPDASNFRSRAEVVMQHLKGVGRLPNVTTVALKSIDTIETAALQAYRQRDAEYMKSDQLPANARITVVCMPGDTAWRAEAEAKGYGIVLVKSDGKGARADYKDIDYGPEIRKAMGVKPPPIKYDPHRYDPDSPFAKLAVLLPQ